MGKKKNIVIDDDEYSLGTEMSEESQVTEEKVVPTAGGKKKKGKKGNSKGAQGRVEEDEEVPEVVFVGKKKSSKKGGGKVSFELLGNEDNDDQGKDESDDEDVSIVSFAGKKKSSKGSKKGGGMASFELLGDENGDDDDGVGKSQSEEEEDVPAVSFTGKKKPSKGKKGGLKTSFAMLDDEENDKDESVLGEEDEALAVSFVGKKKSSKSSKKGGSLFSAALLEEDGEEDGVIDDEADIVAFTGKKKSSKKKGSNALAALGDDTSTNNNAEVDDSVSQEKVSVAMPETSKNKKKKKKGGRTTEEQDDLDKILAELGEGPAVSKPEPSPAPVQPSQAEKVDTQLEPVELTEATGEKEGEDEGIAELSAAAKKKKKKKEKEKEKKAAAAAEQEKETKSKAVDKKVPSYLKGMREQLARRQEAEERQKKEEEERLRKEEEERLKQEELLRQAEEAKLRKKEKDKEKLRLKKEAGLLLTAKQKEEQRRREAMRSQFLASAGIKLPASDNGAPTKRPIYTTKKSKSNRQTNGSKTQTIDDTEITQEAVGDSESVETEKLDEVCTMDEEEKAEVANDIEANVVAEEEEEDDDEDWDAKSWDDNNLSLPVKGAFEDEEADSGAQSVVKKEVKQVAQSVCDTSKPAAAANEAISSQPTKGQTAHIKQKHTDSAGKKSSSDIQANNSEGNLRSPICCIMGHVDTGKTKLLDCIRHTNVQEGEAGGITQQIGATYFPAENIRERTRELKADAKLNVPGLLVIDTPGHESFTNLRSRGSGLCDIAILVVDIMHGLEPQTIESLNLLRMRNTEFIVALNKVDRLYGWKTLRNAPIVKALKQQSKDVQNEFNMRVTSVITQFKEQGLNTELYYKNKDMGETFNIVPTSAISGEGVPDLLLLLVQWSQKTMIEKLTFKNELECTVLEVKVVEGHGTTIDVVLVNGVLHEGDQIVVCGMQGPIVTTIRALLTPHPMKELRVKGTYLHHKQIKAAQGIKISAQGLEHAIAGTGLYVVGPDDDLEEIKRSAMEDMESVLNRIEKTGEGVCVQASTLGSLEALLEFLKSPAVNIPVSGISIGPVHKKDVMRASVMLEKKKEYATILAFDVKVTTEVEEFAEDTGVKIFKADIIYHLFDQFKAYIDGIKEEKKKEAAEEAVFPCVLKIMRDCVFNKKDPIVLGVDVIEGVLKMGTPICVPSKDFIDIGRIASIEINKKPIESAKKGQQVAIKIVGTNPEEQQKMFGRHFDIEDELVSHISRKSIDVLKANYKKDESMPNENWRLLVKLKNLFKIQ
ncbi:eukaryotic translation initiation factor 5B-like [Chenopodium quinoa]|uniref:eukaryotic translation initiation factor 5B-like n=1 Tax=Chenopodium quinoa TaxID=63459 RepID=UPI000B7842C3|nr:eukaryotic translation initiation factor 5B-like [Chenopodium quinoa]